MNEWPASKPPFFDIGTIEFDDGSVERLQVCWHDYGETSTVEVFMAPTPLRADSDGNISISSEYLMGISSEYLIMPPAQAFELTEMIRHAAAHAADAAGLCPDCGGALDEHEVEEAEHQDVSRWEDVEFLNNASEHLDSVLATLREKHATGDTWNTAQIAEELILSNDQFLAYDGPEGGGPMLLDAVTRLAATAIQRLVSGDQ